VSKLYNELFLTTARDGEVEENRASLHPETILTDNYLIWLRKTSFERILKQIEVRFCKRQSSKMCEFVARRLIINVDSGANL